MATLTDAAVAVLSTTHVVEKTALSLATARDWRNGVISEIGATTPPPRPSRPEQPVILPPNKMPRRGIGARTGRVALIHALTHIEFNAIDLAWDIIARFTDQSLPRAFYDDWVSVAADETEHFLGLNGLMQAEGARYGDLPAHDGLWQAAEKTSDDLLARLAVIPMTLEARALDTAPTTIDKLDPAAERTTIEVMRRVVTEEIDHVAIGVRWFDFLCQRDGRDAATTYQAIIRQHFPKGLKRPFNSDARSQAGMPPSYYEPLASPN